MEAYQVYAAPDAVEYSRQFPDMCRGIIKALEHYIFEGDSSLSAEIKSPDNIKHFLYRMRFLYRHHSLPFLVKRAVKAHSQVTTCSIEVLLYLVSDTDSAYRDPGRAPSVSPWRGHYLKALQYLCKVIKRLTHTHVNNVTERCVFRNTAELV